MVSCIIALGSNQGDRHQHLIQAVTFLESISPVPLKKSALFETEPVGDGLSRGFLNAVVELKTDLPAVELMLQLQNYEKKVGRTRAGASLSDRPIDLDIISYGQQNIGLPEIKIPHPRYHQRLFVLIPLKDLRPDWSDEVLQMGIQEMIDKSAHFSVFKTNLNW